MNTIMYAIRYYLLLFVAGECVFSGWISIMLHHRNNTLSPGTLTMLRKTRYLCLMLNALLFRPNYSLFSHRSFISLCLVNPHATCNDIPLDTIEIGYCRPNTRPVDNIRCNFRTRRASQTLLNCKLYLLHNSFIVFCLTGGGTSTSISLWQCNFASKTQLLLPFVCFHARWRRSCHMFNTNGRQREQVNSNMLPRNGLCRCGIVALAVFCYLERYNYSIEFIVSICNSMSLRGRPFRMQESQCPMPLPFVIYFWATQRRIRRKMDETFQYLWYCESISMLFS